MKNSKPELDTLFASLLYLMSRFGKSNDFGLIEAIKMHLQMVLEHPDSESETIHKTCRRLQLYWSTMHENKPCRDLDTINGIFKSHNYFNIH